MLDDLIHVRTSLERSPSGVTEQEKADRLDKFERDLWFKHRVVVVHLREPRGLPRLITMALEAWGQGRWGKARHE